MASKTNFQISSMPYVHISFFSISYLQSKKRKAESLLWLKPNPNSLCKLLPVFIPVLHTKNGRWRKFLSWIETVSWQIVGYVYWADMKKYFRKNWFNFDYNCDYCLSKVCHDAFSFKIILRARGCRQKYSGKDGGSRSKRFRLMVSDGAIRFNLLAWHA